MNYILIEDNLFDAAMSSQLKNFVVTSGDYVQDTTDTMFKIKLDDDKDYIILSWDDVKPTSVLNRYEVGGSNPRTNKIFTDVDEFRIYIKDNTITQPPTP